MVCLIEKHYLKELKEYANILGSEDAAYYVLACNNGYTLDRNQNGDSSTLFSALLDQYGGDESKAIRAKAVAFGTPFTSKYGEWYETNQEPNIVLLNDDKHLYNSESIDKVIPGSKQLIEELELHNFTDRTYAISLSIDNLRKNAVDKAVLDVLGIMEGRHVTAENMWWTKHDAAIKFDYYKFEESMGECIKQLIDRWGFEISVDLKTGKWLATSKYHDAETEVRLHFVNSLRSGEWKDKDGNVYTGIFEEEDGPDHFMHTLLISMENGDASTVIEELAHSYIRMFWNSQLVQDSVKYAIDTLTKETGKTPTAEDIEEYIASSITRIVYSQDINLSEEQRKEYDKRNYSARIGAARIQFGHLMNVNKRAKSKGKITGIEYFKSFWKEFNKLLHTIIGSSVNENRETKQNVIDCITAAFTLKQDLSKELAKEVYMPKPTGTRHQTMNIVKEVDVRSISSVVERVSSRISSEKALLLRDNDLINRLEIWLEKIKARNIDSPQDIINTLEEVIIQCTEDIAYVYRKLADIDMYGIDAVSPKEFVRMRTDIIGFYKNLLSGNLIKLFEKTQIEGLKEGLGLPNRIMLLSLQLDELSKKYNSKNNDYVFQIIDTFVDNNVDIGDKEIIRANMKMWVQNQIQDGDLTSIELWLAPGVVSNSPIVRMIDYMTREINSSVNRESLKVGHRLVQLFEKAKPLFNDVSPTNFFKHFVETDEQGRPTGNFIRELNYGLMTQKKNEAVRKLMKKHNLAYDENDKIFFPDEDTYRAFNDDLDDELDKLHIHRRYTSDYYKARRKILSRTTIDKMNEIQRQIDIFNQRMIDIRTGVPLLSNLSTEEQAYYKLLKRQKELLGNPYEMIFDDNGNVISFIEKEGEAKKIADEILKWNTEIQGKIKYTSDWQRYNSDRLKLVDAYGENSAQVITFDRNNITRQITPDFYKDLFRDQPEMPDELKLLYKRKNAILDAVNQKGYSIPHLEKLNDDAIKELKRLDEQISILQNGQYNENFNDIAQKNFTPAYDDNGNLSNETYFNKVTAEYNRLKLTDPVAAGNFYDKYFYEDSKGALKPLTMFKYTAPKSERYVKDLPSGEYTTVDLESFFIDPDYDPSQGEYLQPDKKYYHNEKWDWLHEEKHKPALDLYNALIKVMLMSYQNMEKFGENSAFRMPQISDSNARLFFGKGFSTHFKRMMKNIWTINEKDLDYHDDYLRRADGTEVRVTPLRWIKPLEDISSVSTDLIQTVTMFYQMSVNYKEKMSFAPIAEMILYETKIAEHEGNQSKRIDKLMDMYIYDRRKTGFGKKGMSDRQKKVFRTTSKALNLAHAKLMAHNWRSVLKNALDSWWHKWTEVAVGKYFNYLDAAWAEWCCFKELIKTFGTNDIGRANVKSKVSAAMLFCGVSGSISEVFKGQRSSWLRRVVSKHFAMGEYTFVDHTFKGNITAMAFHSIRKVQVPGTNEYKFVNKDEARYMYAQAGLKEKDGYKAWKKANTTLWDAYDVNERGDFVLKKEFEDLVRPYIPELGRRSKKIETRIEGLVRERTAVINGMIDELDKNALSTNCLGMAALLMRGWLVTQAWDHLKKGYDFAIYKTKDSSGLLKSNLTKSDIDKELTDERYLGQYNFTTGFIEKGNWLGLYKAMARLYLSWLSFGKIKPATIEEKRNVIRINMGMLGIIMVCALTYFAGSWAMATGGDDDDFESRFSRFLYTVSVAAASERTADVPFLAPITLIDLIKTPFVASTLIQDFEANFNFFIKDVVSGDLWQYAKYRMGWSDDASDLEKVTRGSYKGMYKVERDFLKSSSYWAPSLSPNNAIKSLTSASNAQTENFYRNILPTDQITYKANFKEGDYEIRPWYDVWFSEEKNVASGKKKGKKKTAVAL